MISTIPIAVLSFFGVFLILFLVPSYARAKNVPVLLSILWLFLTGICTGTNTAAWQSSTEVKWLPYCEIGKYSTTHVSATRCYNCIDKVERLELTFRALQLYASYTAHPLL